MQSKAVANGNTILLWRHLLGPIEAIAHRLDPVDCPDLYETLDYYLSEPEVRKDHTQEMLAQYQEERTQKGVEAAQEIDAALLALPRKAMKLSAILERLNQGREVGLCTSTIRYHLNGLIRSGKFRKPKKGHYERL